MKQAFLRKLFCLTAVLATVLFFCPNLAMAQETAADISGKELILNSGGFRNLGGMFDGVERNGSSSSGKEETFLVLEAEAGIGSLYLIFNSEGVTCTVTDNATGIVHTPERAFFYHQYLDLTSIFGYAPASVTLDFGKQDVRLNELYAYTAGEVPAVVQKWDAPAEGKADLLLLSAHGDDDQIFFAGVLPYYAVHMGYQVQVIYLSDHHNFEPYRVHEMMDGLWAAGVRSYPIFGTYPDYTFTDPSKASRHYGDIQYAYRYFDGKGFSREQMLGFVVEQLRRFDPKVAVTHDFAGEYGHSHHMVCADLMTEAVQISMDASFYPESAEVYGVWDVPKTYIHLYEENSVFLDLDAPLDCFDGLSAFEVSKEVAFPCHKSQYKAVSRFINPYPTAAEMKYSPSLYGLYRSTVGEDIRKDDFFENVLTHAQQAQKEEEERLAEEARLAEETRLAEEVRKAEEALLVAEEKAAEEARLAEEIRLAIEAERQKEMEMQQKRVRIFVIAGGAVALLSVMILLARKRKKENKNFSKK